LLNESSYKTIQDGVKSRVPLAVSWVLLDTCVNFIVLKCFVNYRMEI